MVNTTLIVVIAVGIVALASIRHIAKAWFDVKKMKDQYEKEKQAKKKHD